MMGKARYVAAAACAALLAAGAGACGTSVSVVTEGAAQGPTIAIGVAADQPGLGYLHGGEYSGFDIDVAKYVAKTLGYAEKQIVFKQLSPAMRASALTDGTVDMVVDSFSMDGTHDGEADVAGPYLTVREALLIRSDSASEITGTDSLSDKTVCAVAGSAADDNIRNRTKNIRTTVAERDTYPQCMTALMIGEADAVAAGLDWSLYTQAHDGDECGCGHDHECGCGHDHAHSTDDIKKDIIFIVTSAVLTLVGVVLLLYGVGRTIFSNSYVKGIWPAGTF